MTNTEHPQTTKVRQVFDEWAGRGRAEGMERSHAPVARIAFDRVPLPPDGWYLDIGCGNGYTVRWAAERAPAGRAVGLDVSEAMIERARAMSAGFPNVEFRRAAFPAAGLPTARFDAIFSMEVLYYLPDLDGALVDVCRLLKPGGRFVCVVDYYGENVASHTWPEEMGVAMTLLDMAGWREAFRRAGFETIEQQQITLPAEQASADWKTTVGSLATYGSRPA